MNTVVMGPKVGANAGVDVDADVDGDDDVNVDGETWMRWKRMRKRTIRMWK